MNAAIDITGVVLNTETIEGTNAADIEDVAYWICRGGWPGALDVEESIALQQSIDYYDAVINSDISRVDNVARDPSRAAILLRSYARHIGSQASIRAICADMVLSISFLCISLTGSPVM